MCCPASSTAGFLNLGPIDILNQIFVAVEAVLCIAECLATSLAKPLDAYVVAPQL